MANNKVEVIPLSDILIDASWNARSGAWSTDTGDDESGGFAGFVKSIEADGQREPVNVRKLAKPVQGKSLQLIAGFRRCEALAQIAAKNKDKVPTVRAFVEEMSDYEARVRNIVENTARDDLKGPDLAFGVFELARLNPAAGQTEIAAMTGKSQPYVGKLLNIMTKILPKITKQWREAKKSVPVVAMWKVSAVDPDRQQEAFDALIKSGEGKTAGKKGWLPAAKERAEKLGALLGHLQKKGLIDCENLVFEESIRECLKFKADCTEKQELAVANAADKGFETALNAPDEKTKKAKGDDDDEDE